MEIVKQDSIKPSVISKEEYERIENYFAQGLKREDVIKNMNYERNWYYRRLKNDPALRRAEQSGYAQCVEGLHRDVVVGIRKSLTGHVETTTKRQYQIRMIVNEEGEEVAERVLIGEIEEDKYFPPNASTLNQVAKQVIAGMKDGDDGMQQISEKMKDMSPEEIELIAEITAKQLKGV